MTKRLWILGASDPEMQAIERLLTDCGEQVAYAAIDGGVRVHPGNAYRASEYTGEYALPQFAYLDEAGMPWPQCQVVLVECGFLAGVIPAEGCEVTAVVDHHRPGDPGYGKPPAEYWRASSLGQVVAILGAAGDEPGEQHYDGTVRVCYWQSETDVSDCEMAHVDDAHLIAAADHCLGAAYRGECPGVDPDILMRWRVSSRAAFQGRSEAAILAAVEAAAAELRDAREVTLRDYRDYHCGEGNCGCGPDSYGSGSPIASTFYGNGDCYCDCKDCNRDPVRVLDMRRDKPIPELPEAAMRMNVGYISGPLIGADGRHKFTCSGMPEQVSAFMLAWGPAHGLTDIYGDPARGFAGGYLAPICPVPTCTMPS